MGNQLVIWLVVGIVSLLVDVFTSAFLFIWFTLGSISSIIFLMNGASFKIQLISFVLVSIISILIGYPTVKKKVKLTIKKTKTMEEEYIGKEVISTKDIEYKANLKIFGLYWSVINKGDKIKKGEMFRIIGIEGNKLIIKK